MDRRNWLWRKRSSEKSPGETESSGSMSSHSERLSDEQGNVTYNTQSPEVTFIPTPDDEDSEKVKALTEKLTAAMSNMNVKEELVKQHAKVAEEAVAGWERAESEVSSLKLQLDTALKKNSALDGALKECVRQLRQGKEDQELKIKEAIEKREREWETSKSELENQLSELRTQLEADRSKASERENPSLKHELVALSKKLEITTIERDLSSQSAENASKQHLESAKKIAKLEAECRKLKFLMQKLSNPSDHRSVTGSITDSQSDYGERLQALETDIHNDERKPVNRSSEIVLMDDFLEMERLVGLPDTPNEPVGSSDTTNDAHLEEKIKRLENEKLELQIELTEFQAQLRTANGQLKDTKAELISLQNQLLECQDQLRKTQAKLKGTETELIEVQTQLIENEDQLRKTQAKLKGTETELIEVQTQLIENEDQLNTTESRLTETRNQLSAREEQLKTSQGLLKDAEVMLMELQTKLIESEDQHTTSQARLVEYRDELEKSRKQTIDVDTKLVELEKELGSVNKLKEDVERELEASNERREKAELKVEALELEVKSLTAKVESLVNDFDSERALTAEITAKCRRLENELSERKFQPQFQLSWNCNADMKAEQEKELEVAASKLADCQKTIASLGKQLQSLATLDDFLEDADSSMEFSEESPIFFKTGELPPSIDCQ